MKKFFVLDKNAMDDKKHALFNKSLWLIVPPTIVAGFWDVVSQDLRLFTACYLTVLLVHFYIIRSLLYSIKAMKQVALSKSFFYVPLFMVDSIAMLYAYHCGLDIVYFIFIGVGFSNVSFAMNYCYKSDHDR